MQIKEQFTPILYFFKFLFKHKIAIIGNFMIAYFIFSFLEFSNAEIVQSLSMKDGLEENIKVNWFNIIASVLVFFLPIVMIANIQNSVTDKNKKLLTIIKIPVRIKTYLYSFAPMFLMLLSFFVSLNYLQHITPQEEINSFKNGLQNFLTIAEELSNMNINEEQKIILEKEIIESQKTILDFLGGLYFLSALAVLLVSFIVPTLYIVHLLPMMFSEKNDTILNDIKNSAKLSFGSFIKIFIFMTLVFIMSTVLYLLTSFQHPYLASISLSIFMTLMFAAITFIYNYLKKTKVEKSKK